MTTLNTSQYNGGTKGLIKGLHFAFIVLIIVIVGMLINYVVFNGFFKVNSQEKAVLIRLGEIQNIYGTGLHWKIPSPIDKVVFIPTSSQSFTIHRFKNEKKIKILKESDPLQSQDYLITADANIVHTNWTVIYHIDNVKKYYTRTLCSNEPAKNEKLKENDATRMLKNLLSSTVIKITAVTKIDNILYNSRKYRNEVTSQFIQRVRQLDIGIEIDDVLMFEQPAPPEKTISAFQRVTQVRSESENERKKAETYSVQQENLTNSERVRILAESRVYKIKVEEEIKANKIYFESILEKYEEHPRATLVKLQTDVLKVLKDAKAQYVIKSKSNGKQEVRLKINPRPKKMNTTKNKQ